MKIRRCKILDKFHVCLSLCSLEKLSLVSFGSETQLPHLIVAQLVQISMHLFRKKTLLLTLKCFLNEGSSGKFSTCHMSLKYFTVRTRSSRVASWCASSVLEYNQTKIRGHKRVTLPLLWESCNLVDNDHRVWMLLESWHSPHVANSLLNRLKSMLL